MPLRSAVVVVAVRGAASISYEHRLPAERNNGYAMGGRGLSCVSQHIPYKDTP